MTECVGRLSSSEVIFINTVFLHLISMIILLLLLVLLSLMRSPLADVSMSSFSNTSFKAVLILEFLPRVVSISG